MNIRINVFRGVFSLNPIKDLLSTRTVRYSGKYDNTKIKSKGVEWLLTRDNKYIRSYSPDTLSTIFWVNDLKENTVLKYKKKSPHTEFTFKESSATILIKSIQDDHIVIDVVAVKEPQESLICELIPLD